jgi:hypothetical protein
MRRQPIIKDKRAKHPAEDYIKAAKLIAQGEPVTKALPAAGFSEHLARKGKAGLTGPLKRALMAEMGKGYENLITYGRNVKPEDMRLAVLGGIARNLGQQTDKGVNSLKLAGSLRELNMFTADSQVGIIVLGDTSKVTADLLPGSAALGSGPNPDLLPPNVQSCTPEPPDKDK